MTVECRLALLRHKVDAHVPPKPRFIRCFHRLMMMAERRIRRQKSSRSRLAPGTVQVRASCRAVVWHVGRSSCSHSECTTLTRCMLTWPPAPATCDTILHLCCHSSRDRPQRRVKSCADALLATMQERLPATDVPLCFDQVDLSQLTVRGLHAAPL